MGIIHGVPTACSHFAPPESERRAVYTEVLPYLRCVDCADTLAPHAIEAAADGELIAGALHCGGCRRKYPIRDGILDMLGSVQPESLAWVVNMQPLTAWGYERLWRPFALTLLTRERFPYRRELPLIAELAQAARGGLVVDVACSNGLYARAITRARGNAPGHVVGVDYSLPMLRQARQFARRAGLRISFVCAVAQRLPLANGCAASAVIGGSLNEIGDADTALDEMRRVLVPAGQVAVMSLLAAQTPGGKLMQQLTLPGGMHFWTPAQLRALFARHHLQVRQFIQHGVVFFASATTSAEDTEGIQ